MRGIKDIVHLWINDNAEKYHGYSTDISPSKQAEAYAMLFNLLKDEGHGPDEVLAHMGAIISPAAPKDVKALKKIAKYRNFNDENARISLSRWCGGASQTIADAFNEVFYKDSDVILDSRPIYEAMCRKRGIKPQDRSIGRPNIQDVSEHLNSDPVEGLSLTRKVDIKSKEEETEETELERELKKYKKFKINPENSFSATNAGELNIGPDPDTLEFFGLSEVDKEKP